MRASFINCNFLSNNKCADTSALWDSSLSVLLQQDCDIDFVFATGTKGIRKQQHMPEISRLITSFIAWYKKNNNNTIVIIRAMSLSLMLLRLWLNDNAKTTRTFVVNQNCTLYKADLLIVQYRLKSYYAKLDIMKLFENIRKRALISKYIWPVAIFLTKNNRGITRVKGCRESTTDVIPLSSSWSIADHVSTFPIKIAWFVSTPCSVAVQRSVVCPIELRVCLTVES